MNQHEHNLIQAVRAALDDFTVPECKNVKAVVNLSKKHMVQNILAEVLTKLGDVPEDVSESVTQEQTLLLIKDANQEAEINKLVKLLEEQKIPAVLLKGWYLKQFYPRSDLRAMADYDIFIRNCDEKKIHNLLKDKNYSVVAFGGKKDNVYKKEPYVILEMHKNLFMFEDNWNSFFNDKSSQMYIWDRVVNVDDNKYVYRMDDELFYVYMIAHIAKHLLDDGGIGLKAILDVWLFLKKKSELCFDIIYRDLDKLGLREFSDNVILLTRYWFDEENNVKPEVIQLGEHILSCGVYGNSSVMVATKDEIMAESPSAFKYLFRRAFPGFDAMIIRYPQLEKKKWLLPFYYIKRLWYSLVHRRNEIKGEFNSSRNIDPDRVQHINKLYKDIGLK